MCVNEKGVKSALIKQTPTEEVEPKQALDDLRTSETKEDTK